MNYSVINNEVVFEDIGQSDLRVIIVSDNHYGSDPTPPHNQGMNSYERNSYLVDCLNIENTIRPIDLVIFNGDFADLSNNYGNLYSLKYILRNLDMPYFFVEGNHDAITSTEWARHFDYLQNYSIKVGDTVFIIVNTFEDTTNVLPPIVNNIDDNWITSILSKYDTEDIVLVGHYFLDDTNLLERFSAKDNVTAGILGHVHIDSTITTLQGLKCYYDGHFLVPENYDWSTEKGWGFRNIERISGVLKTSLIYVPHTYHSFDVPERIETELVIM